jgi:hypothetical protein
MKKWIALAALLLPMSVAGCSHPQPVVVYAPPPPELSAAAHQGYNAGIEAAGRDLANGRPLNLEAHPRFRNPPVPPPLVDEYRHGFRAGYEQVIHHGSPPGN